MAMGGCEASERSGAGQAAATRKAPAIDGGLLAMFGNGGGAPALEEADRRQARIAARRAYAAPEGKPVHWQNPRSGTFGEIVPVGRPQERGGQVCREFRQMVLVAGRAYQAAGTSCGRTDAPARSDIGRSGSGADAGKQG